MKEDDVVLTTANMLVYKQALYRQFHASPCSLSALFLVLCLAAVIIVPYFSAYDPYNFWIKTNTYREQPFVEDMHQLILEINGVNAEGVPFAATVSTLGSVNRLYPNSQRPATVRSRVDDINDDGIPDILHITAIIPLNEGERATSITIGSLLRVTLRDRARLQFDAIAYHYISGDVPGQALNVDTNLRLRQTWPLQIGGGFQYPYAEDPLLDHGSVVSSEQALLSTIVQKSLERNLTVALENPMVSWRPTVPISPLKTPTLSVTLVLRINQQDVLYTPPVIEVVQQGWIQYLAVFLVVWYLIDKLCSFVFWNQLVETRVIDHPYKTLKK